METNQIRREDINKYSRVQNLSRYKKSLSKEPILKKLFSTDDILIIDKPHDLRLNGNFKYTVENLIKKQYSSFCEDPPNITYQKGCKPKRKLKFCHQLDYATSGILCLGFNKRSTGKVAINFKNRIAKKYYLAVCFGHINVTDKKEIIIETNMGKDENDTNGFMEKVYSKNSGKGRYAKTILQVLKLGFYNGQKVTKVLLKPESGRRHQLRLHLHHIGFPILGDCTYAKDGVTDRMCLHAYKLWLPNFKEGGMWFKTDDPFIEYCK